MKDDIILLGVICKAVPENDKGYRSCLGIEDTIYDYFKRDNVVINGISSKGDEVIPDSILQKYDAFIIPGGAYRLPDNVRNIIKYCENENVPLFGICLGQQFISYANDSKLIKVDVSHKDSSKDYRHNINIEEGSWLYNLFGNTALVNSFHSYALEEKLENYDITAKSDDDVIEAITHKDGHIFGVQWHPETMNDEHKAIADYFIDYVSINKNEKRHPYIHKLKSYKDKIFKNF